MLYVLVGILSICHLNFDLLYCLFKVTDLHRHNIDHITIPSERGPEFGVLRRVDDVSFLKTICVNSYSDINLYGILYLLFLFIIHTYDLQ